MGSGTGNSMNNLLSYCGLVDARTSASEKDLPVFSRLRATVFHRLTGTLHYLWHAY